MTIFRYALLRGVRSPFSLVVNCVLPIGLMFVRTLWEDGGGLVGGFSFLVLVIMSGAYLMSMSILSDKTEGTITRILAAPVTMRRYLTENLLACMVPLMVQITLISIFGVILYDWSLTLSMAVFLCYTVLGLASVTMAFAWHCLFRSKEGSGGGFGLVLSLTVFLSGATFPLDAFPGVLQYVGAIFPVYWAIQGVDAVLETGAMAGDYWISLAAMLLFATACLLYGGKRRIV